MSYRPSVRLVSLAGALVVCGVILTVAPSLWVRAASGTKARSGSQGLLVRLSNPNSLPAAYTGAAGDIAALQTGAKPTALTSADFDADGAEDMVAGYSTGGRGVITLQRGNPDAFAPRNASLYAQALRGKVPPSFLPETKVFAVPESPDFLATGDFNHDGHQDVLVGAHGGGLYLMAGDGQGNLGDPERVVLPGVVSALAVTGSGHVAVAVDNGGNSDLLILDSKYGFQAIGTYALPGPATAAEWGKLGDEPSPDVAVAAGGKLVIVYDALSDAAQSETVDLPFQVQSVALGDFIWDRDAKTEIAAEGEDGAVRILQRGTLDTRPLTAADIPGRRARALALVHKRTKTPAVLGAWTVAKQIDITVSSTYGVAPQAALQTSRVGALNGRGLMMLDSAQRQINVISASADARRTSIALSGSPVSLHTTAQKLNGRRDLVVLTANQVTPTVVSEAADPVDPAVNTTADTDGQGACTNPSITAGTLSGTISLRTAVCAVNNSGAGSYVISVPPGTYSLTAAGGGELQVGTTSGANISITGTGTPANTIIKQTDGVNRVIEQDAPFSGGVVIGISNVTLTGGTCTISGIDCGFGGGAMLGGGNTGDDLTLTNVVFDSNNSGATDLGGGMNFGSSGNLTIINSTISNNTAPQAAGGGIAFINNASSGSLSITNTVFKNNTTTFGTTAPLGGGLVSEPGTGDTATVSGSTFTGNSAAPTGQGGAIFATLGITVSNSRIVGNTAATGSGFVESGGTGNTGIVIDNWWGCNAGPGNAGCDAVTTTGSGTVATFNPWLVLGISATSTQLLPNGTSTLTADLTHNSSGGTGFTVPDITPVTFGGTFDASVTQPGTLTNGSANSTWTAVGTAPHTGSGTANVDNQTQSVTIYVVAPPTISKSFGAASIPVGGTTALTFQITNPNPSPVTLNGINFTDVLPAGLVVATPNGAGLCGGGTVTATSGSGSISLSGASLAGSGTCTFSVNVTGTTEGAKSNTTGNVSSSNGGTGLTASANLKVFAPPTITKLFGAASIPLNGSTTLSFHVTTSAANPDILTGVGFIDTLPAGLVVSTPNGLTGSCGGGTITATAGSNSVSLSGAALAAGSSGPVGSSHSGPQPQILSGCSFTVNVTGTTAGLKNNSVTVTSTEGGTGNTSNASLTVIGPPLISKAFVPATVPLGNDSTVTLLITNPNSASGLSSVAFTDTLPSGLVVSSSPNVANSCNGTVTAVAASSSISLSGGTLSSGGSCAISVNVTPASAINYNNTTSTIGSTEGGSGAASNTAMLTVINPACDPPPTGMTSWWPGEGNANDVTGGYNGTVHGATFASGEVGQAFSFNGANNDYVFAASTTNIAGGPQATYDAWVYPTAIPATDGTYTAIFGAGDGTQATYDPQQCKLLYLNTGGSPFFYMDCGVNNANTVIKRSTANSYLPNEWYHIAGVVNNGNIDLYVNGVLDNGTGTSVTGASINTSAAQYAWIGALASSNQASVTAGFTGLIDEVEIFSRSLTATEVQNIYRAGNKGKCKLNATISKAFSPATIPVGLTSSMSFTINNTNAEVNLTGVAFSDTLPTGLTTSGSATNTCGGTPVVSSGSVSLTGGTVAAGGSCTLSVSVTSSLPASYDNTTGAISTTEAGTGSPSNTATLLVLAPPSISKGFSPASALINGTSTLSFTINNANPSTALAGVAFTDTFPAGLQVASPSNATGTCGGGTFTAPSGSGSVSLAGGSIAGGGPCTLLVDVTPTTGGTKNNVSGNVSSTNGGTGNTASATLTVGNPPTIAKSFSDAVIPNNTNTTLSFTLTNPAANTTSVTGVGFLDTLPAGLVVATPNGLIGACDGGTITAVAGSGSVSLAGATLGAGSGPVHAIAKLNTKHDTKLDTKLDTTNSKKGGISPSPNVPTTSSCTFSVNVTASTAGVKNNSVTVTSDQGTGNTSNAAVTVDATPTLVKQFGAPTIPTGGSTALIFTVTNPNSTNTVTGIGFSDNLPLGLVVSAPNGLTGSCGAGTITATTGSTNVSLSGGTVAAGSSCTFSVNVTGNTAGDKNNTTGALTSTEGGTGGTASASVSVVEPPSIAKAFSPTSIALNATTSLTFTITNPSGNTVSLTGVGFTDTLPTGLTVATASAPVCGGTLTVTNPMSIALSGAGIAANSQCLFSVTVTGAAPGQFTNTTGNVNSTNGGAGNTASANLSVATPPTISKSFGAATIPLNGTTSLSFTITNPSTTNSLTGVGFTDILPAGIVVATPNGLAGSCDGGTISATAGAASVSLSGATLTAGSGPAKHARTSGVAAGNTCTFSVNVTGTTAGVKNNSVTATSNEGGSGNTSNASITVVAPPTIGKAFGTSTIPLNTNVLLTFSITNPNSIALSGVAFSDTLPAGLTVAAGPGVINTCGGTFTAAANATSVSLSGGTLLASSSCSIQVNATGTSAGVKNNTTGVIISTEGGTGTTSNTATVTVVAPPTISKGFSPNNIPVNGTSTLSFTIANPNATVGLNGLSFSDTFPAGVQVYSAPGVVDNCGGTFSATSGANSVGLTGGAVGAGVSCTISVTVQGTIGGTKLNTTGPISSTNGGTGTASNTAMLQVGNPATISKSFSPTSIPVGGTSTLTLSLHNPNTALTLTGLSFSDPLPTGMTVASSPGATNTCSGTFSAAANATTIGLAGGSLAANASCTLTVKVTSSTGGLEQNTAGAVSSNEGGTGVPSNSATLTVVAPPTFGKHFGGPSVPINSSTSLTFNIGNPNTTTTLTGIGFSDSLPSGLVVSTPNGLTGTCGGTITAAQASTSISLSGASLAASASCSFSVNVMGAMAGTKNNVTGAITSHEGSTGGTATATIAVVKPPSIVKSFGMTSIALNASTKLIFSILNPSANTVPLTGLAFTDNLPAGLVITNPNELTGNCNGGTVTATPGSTSFSLTGGTLSAMGSCTIYIKVTATTGGQKVNVTTPVTSTNGGTGNTATATLTVSGSGPVIGTQPISKTVCEKTSVSFTASASGSPTPTVQWQVSTNGGGTWSNISGATSTTLTFTTAAGQNGNKYRAVFTNGSGSVPTNAATLTVNTDPTITTQPVKQTVTAGHTATFTAAASSTPTPTVQWQVSTNSGSSFTNIPAATSTSLSFTASAGQNHNQYRAVFTNSCTSTTTKAVVLTVN